MYEKDFLDKLKADKVVDCGNLDCGSGLLLQLSENMLSVPNNGVLELKSAEISVAEDLPPWCLMKGYEFLGVVSEVNFSRYFIRKKAQITSDSKHIYDDRNKTKLFECRIRNRASGHLKSTSYCRNFSFQIGQPVVYDEKDNCPTALEYFIGALAASLTAGFNNESNIYGLLIDDIEITIKCKLHSILAHLGAEAGDPSISSIDIKCFISSMEEESKIKKVWETSLKQCPILTTLKKNTIVDIKLNIV